MASKFLLFGFLLASTHSSPIDRIPETRVTTRQTEYRLPTGAVETISYKIDLRLGTDLFDTNKFTGDADVRFRNLLETNAIQIHANGITFDSVVLKEHDGNVIEFEDDTVFEPDSDTDIMTLTTKTALGAGTEYHLTFTNYEANFRTNELYGFYKSTYTDSQNATRLLGTTQFQPTHARKAFPCFDEPLYKAVFDISIRHSAEYRALGNTAETRVLDATDPAYAITTFATTPKMSTYLIAFIVSDFSCTEGQPIEYGIHHFVCSRTDSWATRNLAVDVGPKLAQAMEIYVDVKYSVSTITKIHEVAIPDFSAGAMENWGLVTYRETALLWDPVESSNANKQSVETIIAHELSHFWFGNLVTCHWWSDTFLNEGFATYFEFFATNEVETDWQMEYQFVLRELHPALVSDASINSAALSSEVYTPSQVSGRFSTVSYSKGGSVFRMVRHFMGLDRFKEGLHDYLDTNKFSAVTPALLWASLGKYVPTGLPDTLEVVMQNWVEKPGFPVITVTADGRNIKLTQKRFLSSVTATDDTTWYVPVSYATSGNTGKFDSTTPDLWLLPTDAETTLTNGLDNANGWIILNNQQSGFYRVDYSDELWDKIGSALRQQDFSGVPEINRAQLADDLYQFARYGYRSYAELLKFYEFLENDTSYFPWYSAFTAFNTLINRIGEPSITTAFEKYLLSLMKAVYDSLPLDVSNDDDQIYTQNRVLIIPWACKLGLPACVDHALAAFAKYRDNGEKPNKNLKSVVYCNGIRHSQNIASDFDFLWQQYLATDLASERSTLLSVMGCATDNTILQEYLTKSITVDSGIRTQDSVSVFSSVYIGNPGGVDVAFDFLLDNYAAISTYYGSMNSISTIFSGLGSRLTRQDQIDKLDNFIQNNDLGNFATAANNALATAKANQGTTQRFEQELKEYFDTRDETTTPADDGSTAGAVSAGFATILTSLLLFYYQYFN